MVSDSGSGDPEGSGKAPSRRLVLIGLPLFLAGCQTVEEITQVDLPSLSDFTGSFGSGPLTSYGPMRDGGHTVAAAPVFRIDPRYRRQRTSAPAKYANSPGTIVVDPRQRFLYLVEKDGKATRYGVGVGREGFAWSGTARVGAKRTWPTWTPPAAMLARDPSARPWKDGMPGGPNNPLGARALYLYQGGRDTLYRIHGTAEPWTIGQAVSSGCIRMINQDVIDLYGRVGTGTRVVVLS